MRPRYLIIKIRDGGSCERVAALAQQKMGLRCVIKTSRLIVFIDQKTELITFGAGRGAVIGTLFTKGQALGRVVDLGVHSDAAMRSGGRDLVSRFWGAYVAVTDAPDGDAIHILRDPSGALTCNFMDQPAGLIISSDAESLLAIAEVRPEVQLAAVAKQLLGQHLPSEETALVGVRELMAGHQLSITPDRVEIQSCWSPWNLTIDHVAVGQRPAEALREVVENTVADWASRFDRILLSVSGGLDSSIVAASLKNCDAAFSCFTHSTDDPAGDERQHARILAAALGVELAEVFFEPSSIDVSRTHASHLARPAGHILGQDTIRVSHTLGAMTRANAFFNGVGGDNVFCMLQSATAITDRLIAEGLSRSTFQTIDDVCRLTDCSVWDAIKMAARRFPPGSRMYGPRLNPHFISQDVVRSEGQWTLHPWVCAQDQLPGKLLHVASILSALNLLGGWPESDHGPPIAPLLSQPVIEICLTIPTWAWCEGGVNRSLARQAFATRLPSEIAWRRSKGTPGAAAVKVFERNRTKLRELVLEGALARSGILDRGALETALAYDGPPRGADYTRILQIADAEAWVRSWNNKAAAMGDQDAVAAL